MKPPFRITPRAFGDLKNIARYTRQQWGEAQRDRYLGALDSRFGWLAEHPNGGKHRPDIQDGYFSFRRLAPYSQTLKPRDCAATDSRALRELIQRLGEEVSVQINESIPRERTDLFPGIAPLIC